MGSIEPASLIPATLLTGFLGSGKTTVLNHVLKQPGMAATAVIVNEFGEIGLDHLLVERSSEDVVLLNSGCLCCTVRNDIVDTLTSLFVDRAKRKVPWFTRGVIETTGLADPAGGPARRTAPLSPAGAAAAMAQRRPPHPHGVHHPRPAARGDRGGIDGLREGDRGTGQTPVFRRQIGGGRAPARVSRSRSFDRRDDRVCRSRPRRPGTG